MHPESQIERGQRYVQGRMPELEAETFELELLSDPALAQSVELDLYLKEGFIQLAEELNPRPQVKRYVLGGYLGALAAGLLMGFGLSTLLQPQQPQALGNLRFVMLDKVRSEVAAVSRVDLPVSVQGLVIEIPAPAQENPQTRLTLNMQDPHGTARRYSELTALDGYVSVVLPRAELRKGRYRLHIEGNPTSFDLEVSLP